MALSSSFSLALVEREQSIPVALGHLLTLTSVDLWPSALEEGLLIWIAMILGERNNNEASVTAGSAAFAAEERKHKANDSKCAELGWVCIPIAVETYGCWGTEAKWAISQLASRLATSQNCSKSASVTALYQRLSMTLVRANVRALLSRAISDTGY